MITDLIANGQAKIDKMQQERDEKEQRRLAEIAEDIKQQEMEIAAILSDNLPSELIEYTGACTELPVYGSDGAFFRIEAPECTAVSFKIGGDSRPEGGRGWVYHFTGIAKFAPNEYSQDRERYTYRVDVPTVGQDDDEGYVIAYRNQEGIDDLETALAYAHNQWLRLPELKAEADKKNAELSEKQARKQAAAEDKAREQAKSDAELAELMADPLIGPLLKLVNAIVNERADYSQRIADMSEAMEAGEQYHGEAMSRLERRVKEEADRRSLAESDAEAARNAASDAEEKARKATKKTGVWG
jgi:hypothetical protein